MSTAGSRQMQGGSHTFPPPTHTHTMSGGAAEGRAAQSPGHRGICWLQKPPLCPTIWDSPGGEGAVVGSAWPLCGLCSYCLAAGAGRDPQPHIPSPLPPRPLTPHLTFPHPLSSWFHGKISGVEAVQELQPPEDGLFLVRESVRHPGDYVLCVSFGKEVIHYRVLHRENTLSIDSEQYFCNLIDMIEVREPIVKDFGVTLVWHTVMENLWGDPDPIHVTSWPHPVASGGFTAAVGGFCYSSPFSTP